MTNEYLVVYEKGQSNWSAFSPDILGCGSMGSDLEEVRMQMHEAMNTYLADLAEAGEAIPAPAAKSVNFEEFDPAHTEKEYFVEWMKIQLPENH